MILRRPQNTSVKFLHPDPGQAVSVSAVSVSVVSMPSSWEEEEKGDFSWALVPVFWTLGC